MTDTMDTLNQLADINTGIHADRHAGADTMDTLNQLADIAVAIDELKTGLSVGAQAALLAVAELLHDIVDIEAGERAAEIYAESDGS